MTINAVCKSLNQSLKKTMTGHQFIDEQVEEFRDAFCIFESNGEGFIPSFALRDIMKTIGMNPTDVLLENTSIAVDADENGRIDFAEFINLMDGLETEEKKTEEGELNCSFSLLHRLLFKLI